VSHLEVVLSVNLIQENAIVDDDEDQSAEIAGYCEDGTV
jgi:hypothetical protein